MKYIAYATEYNSHFSRNKKKNRKKNLPYIISLAVRFPVPYEASARLVQVLVALHAFQTGCVPLQVRGDPQNILVMDLTAAAYTHR